jgi:hypothetical protein
VRQWVADQRKGVLPSNSTRPQTPYSDQSIQPRNAALKAFTHKYLYKGIKWTERDLLEEEDRFELDLPSKKPLSEDELEKTQAEEAGRVG